MSKCSICNSEHCAAIDDLLDSGAFQRDVAAQFSVSRFALSRHVRHSKPAPAPAPENGNSESLEVQAARWLSRADDVYASSTANQDTRGQVQALTAAFRGLELQHKSEKAAEAAPAGGDGAEPVTIEMIDAIVRKAEAEINATPRGRTLEELRRAPDHFVKIAGQLLHDPELFKEVEQRCATRRTGLVN